MKILPSLPVMLLTGPQLNPGSCVALKCLFGLLPSGIALQFLPFFHDLDICEEYWLITLHIPQ